MSVSTTSRSEELVLEHMDYARKIARNAASKFPIEEEDAIQAALIGLLEAARRYDPAKNDHFRKYAYLRINGAIVDEVRRNSFVSRTGHEQGLRIEMKSLDETYADSGIPIYEVVDKEGTPELGVDLQAAMDTLTERERKVMWGLAAGLTSREIGKEFGVTESRISQIATKARQQLQEELEYEYAA